MKTILFIFSVGALTSLLAYQTYVSWHFYEQYTQDHTVLVQVVTFINNATRPPAK